MSTKLLTMFLVIGICIMAGVVSAQEDPIGKVDTVTLYVHTIADGKWMISAHIWNDEELAAIDIPIAFTAGVAKLMCDSVSYTGTRADYFAQKYSLVDTTSQMMHFGGFAYMGPDKPPLAPGDGEVARVYISTLPNQKVGPFAVDTTTVPPNSTLMLVDKNAAIIKPAFKIKTVEALKEKPEKK